MVYAATGRICLWGLRACPQPLHAAHNVIIKKGAGLQAHSLRIFHAPFKAGASQISPDALFSVKNIKLFYQVDSAIPKGAFRFAKVPV